jgi:hypothetical protein
MDWYPVVSSTHRCLTCHIQLIFVMRDDSTDPNMRRFWLERNLPVQLYYNHSALANEVLFPRVHNVSWGALNSSETQTMLVHRVIWIIEQLLESQPSELLMMWQPQRVRYLEELKKIYEHKLDIIAANNGIAFGMIPKWYHG